MSVQSRMSGVALITLLFARQVMLDNACMKLDESHDIGKRLSVSPFNVLYNIGSQMCYRECEAYALCLSINYNRKMLMCELNSQKRSEILSLVNDDDFIYREIPGVLNYRDKRCGTQSCDQNARCERTTFSGHICIAIGPSVGDRCSSDVNCPDNAVCDEGTCVCNGTYLPSGKACHNVTNLALGKNVSASSHLGDGVGSWQNAVDGRTRVGDMNLLFHTSFELYPWLTITLGRLSIVKSITLYNRLDGGRWLHNVETRIGNSSDWSQMSTCGTYVGPSVTGGVHVIECGKLLYGMFVTVKIVQPNYITDDPNASGGNNCLVLAEVVVAGVLV